jgi:acyl carrier protein
MNKNEIFIVVTSTIKSLVDTLPDEQKFKVEENTKLFGEGSIINSLSLVSIIVDLETTFSIDYGFDISLTDDRAMMKEKSPFESVSALVDYIDELVNEK